MPLLQTFTFSDTFPDSNWRIQFRSTPDNNVEVGLIYGEKSAPTHVLLIHREEFERMSALLLGANV